MDNVFLQGYSSHRLTLPGSRSLVKLSSQDVVFESFTAILYDVILFSMVTERAEDFTTLIDEVCIKSLINAILVLTRSSQGVTEQDFFVPDARTAVPYPTVKYSPPRCSDIGRLCRSEILQARHFCQGRRLTNHAGTTSHL